MMRSHIQIACASLAFLAVHGIGAETDGFLSQTITLPAKGMVTRFADLDGKGRFDLLAVDSKRKQLLIYRQRASGFTNSPDQVIELPPDTGWVAPFHLDAGVAARERRPAGHTNFDLLVSTAIGLDYYQQDGGVFESKPRVLLQTNQVFTGDDSPALLSAFTNAAIPVISATKAWYYKCNDELEWTSGPPMLLNIAHGNWSGSRGGWSGWSLGPDAARTLTIERHFLSRPQPHASFTPENEGIAKLISKLKEIGSEPETTEVDLDRDGRKDLVVWQVTYPSFRTDFYIFLRGADDRLPERPTQILHCRGIPIPVNSTWNRSPIADLEGNGRYELVLLEPDFVTTSIGGLVDTALTRGVKMAITVRLFNHGVFARSGDTAVSFMTQLSIYGSWQWPFLICGDFNGDGRPDLIVKRSATQWEIYYSTGDGHWFEPQPAMTFEIPSQGYFERRYFEISDLNGDGRSDIISHDLDDPRIFILLTKHSP
ncbi:MAG TPA: VCBS repeat-containing protein [Alphaproteobacteria bacterium]|nr:VCBS repeat-containing protein [Alphaproteobacteria bacterium]